MGTEYGGYMGKILRIDLTTETAEEYPFTDQQRLETLGGKNLAYRILADQLTGEEQAFSEENPVIVSTGPLTGTDAPGSARFEITAISPQTSLPVSSNCGGKFGVFLKKAGFDALILCGRCKTHRWVEIRETGIRFHDAADLWGRGTASCSQQLTQHNPCNPFGYLCIGPAGEELLSSATIISGGRSVGKPGFGAVLGWKNLKAITVSGNKAVPLYDPVETTKEIRKWNGCIQQNPRSSDPGKSSSCPGCPIRCKSGESSSDPVLIDLGLDTVDAPNFIPWLQEKLGYLPEFPVVHKQGQRRKKLYREMLEALVLPDCESSYRFYQNLTEAISALGLCIFTVGVSVTEIPAENLPVITTDGDFRQDVASVSISLTRLLRYTTGFSMHLGVLLVRGKQSRECQDQVYHYFQNRNTASDVETG